MSAAVFAKGWAQIFFFLTNTSKHSTKHFEKAKSIELDISWKSGRKKKNREKKCLFKIICITVDSDFVWQAQMESDRLVDSLKKRGETD